MRRKDRTPSDPLPGNGSARYAPHAPSRERSGEIAVACVDDGQAGAGAGALGSGRESQASAPPVGVPATEALPPCDFAIVSTIDSPSPLPPPPPRVASARVKRSKARGRNAAG